MRLQTANPRTLPGHGKLHLLSGLQVAVYQRTGNHRAEPGHRKRAVYGQARPRQVALGRDVLEHRVNRADKLRQPLARVRRHRQNPRPFQRGASKRVLHVRRHQLQPLVVNEVRLRERHHAARYPEQVQYRQMLPRLRHYRLVRRHYQQRDVYPADARQHIVDEPLMTRHVNDADFAAGRQPEPRKAQVYRQPALFLLGESVRVYPRQRLDERGLAVIYVSRCANYEH